MSVNGRLDRLERRLPPPPERDYEALDREIETLAAEFEAREGPGAFAALIAEVRADFEAAGVLHRDT